MGVFCTCCVADENGIDVDLHDWNNPVIQTSAVNLTKPKNFSETFADIFSFRYEIFKIQFFSLITDALEGGFYIW